MKTRKIIRYVLALNIQITLHLGSITAFAANDIHSPNKPSPKIIKDQIIEINNSFGCSGFFVSQDGYFVTALHCAYKFLMNRNGKKPRLDGENFNNTVQAKTWMTSGQNSSFKFEEIYDFRNFSIKMSDDLPTTVHIGKGYIETAPLHNKLTIKNLTNQDMNFISKLNEDFIILKFNLKTPASCFKVTDNITSGEPLWSYGYTKNKYGATFLKSSSGYAANRPMELYNSGFIKTLPIEDSIFDWKKLAIGGFSINSGMSGGPIINIDDEVIGVNSISVGGITIFQRMSYIVQSAQLSLGKNL